MNIVKFVANVVLNPSRYGGNYKRSDFTIRPKEIRGVPK